MFLVGEVAVHGGLQREKESVREALYSVVGGVGHFGAGIGGAGVRFRTERVELPR